MTGCTLVGNSANYGGGGAYNFGTLSLTACVLSGNSATGTGSAGGGVFEPKLLN